MNLIDLNACIKTFWYMYLLSLSGMVYPVADPGFPVVGGRAPVRGGVDLRCGHFSVKMYGKTKELGPMGVACARHAPPPRSANATYYFFSTSIIFNH